MLTKTLTWINRQPPNNWDCRFYLRAVIKRLLNMDIKYIRSGDYFIPDLKLPEEARAIGKWGRMHRDYLKEHHPIQFNNLVLSSSLWTYLADLNEQAQLRMDTLIVQMQSAESITEELKAANPICWAQRMNNITARAEKIIREELIYNG